jgi:hypothetical protein
MNDPAPDTTDELTMDITGIWTVHTLHRDQVYSGFLIHSRLNDADIGMQMRVWQASRYRVRCGASTELPAESCRS